MINESHWYATTAYSWVVADSRDKAIKKATSTAGSSILKRTKANGKPGVEATVCRVPLPKAARYTIEGYFPRTITKEDGVNDKRKGEVIQLEDVEHVYLTTMSGETVPR